LSARTAQIVFQRIDQTWSILFPNGQNSGTQQEVNYIHPASAIPPKPAVGDFEQFFFRHTAIKQFIQSPQILEYPLRFLPLLDDYDSDFMPEPLPKLIKEAFHTPDSKVIDPSSDDLVQLDESHRQRS
jgi:hypothetical protein